MLLLLAASNLPARASSTDSVKGKPSLTVGGFFDSVYDRFGTGYPLYQLATDTGLRSFYGRPTPQADIMYTCNSGYFQIYLEPGCGMDSFLTVPAHQARLNVICQVLHDLSSFISSPLTLTGKKVNILIRNPAYMLAPSAAAAASGFYAYAKRAPAGSIADNVVWTTIHSGQDAYTSVINPLVTNSAFYHGIAAFNFSSLTWHTNLTTAPSAVELDLYSIALHEFSHLLGFATLIEKNGNSIFGPAEQYYSRYDLFLKNASGTNLISNSGSCSLYNYTFSASTSDLQPNPASCSPNHTVCASAVRFSDGIISQPVYTPNCWEGGSSLSHFADECQVPASFYLSPPASNNLYFVMSYASAYGKMTRYPKSEERQAFCDIGYTCDTIFGSTPLNDTNYHGSVCPGINVAGINDGINSTGGFTYVVTAGSSIALNNATVHLLANDNNADSFTCLQVITGGGTLSATAGGNTTTLTYTPSASSASGLHLLRYIPVNSTTGARGNITYIYVFVGSAACTPSACNMLANPGFETGTGCGATAGAAMSASISCWTPITGTPDLISYGCTSDPYYSVPTAVSAPATGIHALSGTPNNNFIGLWSSYQTLYPTDPYFLEGVETNLTSGLQPGVTYVVSYWAKIRKDDGWNITLPVKEWDSYIQFLASPGLVPQFNTAYLTPLAQHLIVKDSLQWHAYTDTFKVPAGPVLNDFYVVNAAYLNPYAPNYSTEMFIDDIQLLPKSATTLFTMPDTVSMCDTVFDLSRFVSIPGGVFSGPAVAAGGGTGNFYPTLAGPGFTPVEYMYYDVNGCQHKVDKTVYVKCCTGRLLVRAGADTVCNRTAVTITASGSTNYNWMVSTGKTYTGCTGCTNSVKTDTPSVTTIYKVATSYYGCPDTASDTVVVNALPSATTTPTGTVGLCVGDTLTMSAATGTGYTYQWKQYNGTTYVNISGATAATYKAITAGVFQVTVTNASRCSATSASISIFMKPLPSVYITADRIPNVCQGQVVVLQDPNLTHGVNYHWYKDGKDTGAANLRFYSAGVTGTYKVVIDSNGCYASSNSIVVTVNPPPNAVITPGSTALCSGNTVTFSANTSGISTYQWYNTGGAISGATGSGYTTGTAGTYYVVETGTNTCIDTSIYATVTVNPSPSDSVSPYPTASFCSGGSVTLTAFTTGTGTSYQWKTSGTNIGGATSRTYNATSAGSYTVLVTSGGCSKLSKMTTVSLSSGPAATITYYGNDVTNTGFQACYGDTLTAPAGSGYTYTWKYNNTTTVGTNRILVVTLTGTYTLTVSVTGSTCAATSQTYATVMGTAGCTPCVAFHGAPGTAFTVLGCTTCTAANFGTGNYYVPGNIVLSGTMTIQRANIMVNGNSAITLASGANVTIDSSHLFGCNPLWNGITYNGNPAVLNIIHSTLIEDAVTAVNITSVPSSTSNIFTSDGAIFNRNQLGILINSYQSISLSVYPFTVRNTVFTSRNLASSYNTWPTTYGLMALSGTPDAYSSPYSLNNYTAVSLQNGAPAQMGMQIQSVGSGGSLYREIKVGDETADKYLNVLDNMQFGIYAHNSNMSVVNSAFCNMVGAPNQGTGILADCNATQDMVYRLRVYAGPTSRANKFYNCSADAVGSFYPAELLFQGNYVISTHTSTWTEGCFVKAGNYYSSLQANNNTLVNVENGVFITTPTNVAAGTINLNNNYIADAPPSYTGTKPASHYIGTAVYAANLASVACPVNTCKGQVNANGNTIYNAYNGILLSSFGNLSGASVTSNTISLIKNPISTQQSGISLTQMSSPNVYNNGVTCASGGTGLTAAGDANRDAIRVNNSTGKGIVNCNFTSYLGKGFEFTGIQGMQWLRNTMTSLYTGLQIITGSIGSQRYDGAINDNSWIGGFTNQTYLYTSIDTNSKLYFPALSTAPTINGTNRVGIANSKYTLGAGLLQKLNNNFADPCMARAFNPATSFTPATQKPHFLLAYHWIAQNATFRTILEDTTLVDSSYMLSDFYTLAAPSRYATLASIENSLATGDIATAQTMMGSSITAMTPVPEDANGVIIVDYDSANQIVNNYLTYYSMYINYQEGNLSSADSGTISSLASLCPSVNGDVIYQARALYSAVYKQVCPFNDDNCTSGGGFGKYVPNQPVVKTLQETGQLYSLFPNPSNGNIQLQQLVTDNNPVRAEVWNEQGQRILQRTLQFTNGRSGLNLKGVIPGIYLLQLRDNAGRNYLLKFTVN